jgi:hypothetical protein
MGVISYFKATGVSRQTLIEKRREMLFSTLRHIVAHQMHCDGYTYDSIAEQLDYDDHSSVIYGVRKIKEMLDCEDEFVSGIRNLYLKRLERYRWQSPLKRDECYAIPDNTRLVNGFKGHYGDSGRSNRFGKYKITENTFQ